MTSIKHLLWQESPKPKRNFIKENAKKFKDPKKSGQNNVDSQNKRSQNTSSLSTNRMSTNPSQHQSVRVSAVPHGLSGHRRPLKAFPVKRPTQTIQPDEPNINQFSLFRDRPNVNAQTKPKEQPKGFRNQACQTVQGKELDHICHDGVIRYPSTRRNRSEEVKSPRSICVREMGLQTEDFVPAKPTGDLTDHMRVGNKSSSIDFVKLNMMAPLKPKQTNTGKDDPIRAPATYQKGVVPKYLREQKKDKENEKEGRGDFVDGNITAQMLLPDDMRKKLLSKLRKDHKELVDQLNLLPFSTSSLKTLQRKQQIEKELDILEKRISNFSREKVFIRDVTV